MICGIRCNRFAAIRVSCAFTGVIKANVVASIIIIISSNMMVMVMVMIGTI